MSGSHFASSGRGGAGNMVDSAKSPKLQPSDLETPTLKTPVVTTGRGGSGNMAKNTDPIETRLRQDVEPVHRRPSGGATHIGRGGTGNVFKAGSEDAEKAKHAQQHDHSAVADDGNSHKDHKDHNNKDGKDNKDEGLAAKGKNFLFGKKH